MITCPKCKKSGVDLVHRDEEKGTLLGVHMMGSGVTELIAEATLAVRHKMKASDITETIHAHPTFSEGLMEACFSFEGKGLHVL